MTLVEHHEHAAVSTSSGRDAERRGDIPASRKLTVSSDATTEPEAKRTRSPRPSEESLALPSPAPSVVGQAGRSEEWARTSASSGSAPTRDPQRGDTPLAASVGMSKPAVVVAHGPIGTGWVVPPSVDVRGHGS